jgi:hypothetical protein
MLSARLLLLTFCFASPSVQAQFWKSPFGGSHASASASASSSGSSASASATASAGNGHASASAHASAGGNGGYASAHASASSGGYKPSHPGHHKPWPEHTGGSHATTCVNGVCTSPAPQPTYPGSTCTYASYDLYSQAYLAAGAELRVISTQDPYGCLAACSCEGACVAYTYHASNQSCYLKGYGVDETPYAGGDWYSGVKKTAT